MGTDFNKNLKTGVEMRKKSARVDVIHFTGDNTDAVTEWVSERGASVEPIFISRDGKFTQDESDSVAKVLAFIDSNVSYVPPNFCVVFDHDRDNFSVYPVDTIDYHFETIEEAVVPPKDFVDVDISGQVFTTVRREDVCEAIVIREGNVEEVQAWIKAKGGSSKNIPINGKVRLYINDSRSSLSMSAGAGIVVIFRHNQLWLRNQKDFMDEFRMMGEFNGGRSSC